MEYHSAFWGAGVPCDLPVGINPLRDHVARTVAQMSRPYITPFCVEIRFVPKIVAL